ncbi:hypothetical protein [Rhizobium sp. MHM7A]|uniref:hypothetical protein n=1 Tax=Rhizobium sp. MHM7A TaxID=2583233 RepID=UPI00110715CF|nr:hypothetical protein [Rhizobium sp. MHM7A]TLX16376.1 hypothetical protein FFR93_03320 [Rhizobium sp. MHM7A]
MRFRFKTLEVGEIHVNNARDIKRNSVMSAMNSLRNYLVSNSLEAKDFTIKATVEMQKAYSKGILDYYEPEIITIELTDGMTTHVIAPSKAFDEVARAVHDSAEMPFHSRSEPRGSEHSFPSTQVHLPLDLTIRRAEAERELQDAMHDDTEGSEQRFEDARWKVFALTDVFATNPCSREFFDAVSLEKERLNDRSCFRDFYQAWNDADESTVVNDEISHNVRELVEKAAEQFLVMDETGDEAKKAIYGSFKVHPRHRPLFDAVVDGIVGARNRTFSR